MSIGLALIVIFILYLIDKHNLWRQAAKIIGGLIVLSILGVGAFYGWTNYDKYRTAKRAVAEQAVYQKSVQDCIARNSGTGRRDIFDQVSAQDACQKDPGTLPPCWSKPALPGGFQFDQNSERGLNGKRIPPDPKVVCYPIAPQSQITAWDENGKPVQAGAYGPTQIYELDGKRYEVPKDTTLDELDAAIKLVSKDPDYAKASPEDQKGYLAYVIETNRRKK